ncbi:MAG: hypothetical protein ACRCRP_02420 [Metamycoplasmataceae bacterium]
MNKKTLFLIGGVSTIAIPLIAVTSCAADNTKYINILPKSAITLSIIEKEINANPIAQTTLNKVFDGINNETFDQVNSAWDPVTKTITLTAKEGYKFGTAKEPQNTVVSAEIKLATALDVAINPKINESVFILGEVEWPGNLSKETLDKAFTGITAENMTHFDSSAELTENNNCLIILTAKPGYGFDSETGSKMISSVFPVRKSNDLEIGRTLKIANNDAYKNQVKEMIFGKDKPITKEAINNFIKFTPEEQQQINEFEAFIKGKVSITKEELKQFYFNPRSGSIFEPDYYINTDNSILFNEFISKKMNDIINSNPKFKGIFKEHLRFTSILLKNPINPNEILGRVMLSWNDYNMIFDQPTKDMMLIQSNWKEAPKLTKKEILINNTQERFKSLSMSRKNPFLITSSKYELATMVLGISPRSGEYAFVDDSTEGFTMFPSIKGIFTDVVEFKDPVNPIVEFSFSGRLYHVFSLSKIDQLISLMEKEMNLKIKLWQITWNDDGTDKVLTPEEQKEVDKIKQELLKATEEVSKFSYDPNNDVSNVGINSITDGPIVIGKINHYTVATSTTGTVLPFGTSLTNTSTSSEIFEAIKNNITIDGQVPTTSPGDIVWTATIDATGKITVEYTSKNSVFVDTNKIIFTVGNAPTTP